jgi:hypothetical protein
MRKIKVIEWKETNQEGKEVKSNTMKALSYCISLSISQDKLRGFDKVRLINRIERAFHKAESSKFLKLEEAEHSFIKKAVEKYAHPGWGAVDAIVEALDIFLEAEEVK